MSTPVPSAVRPLVVPLRDALVVLAVLVVLALAANLALYAYLPQRAPSPDPPFPARGECVWERARPADYIPARRSEMLP